MPETPPPPPPARETPPPPRTVETRPMGPTPGSVQEFVAVAGDRVFFDYDQATVRTDGRPVLDK
ncbi:hypothetical protein ACNJU9_21855, partial [Mycobacterium tuberculosis]